MNYQQIGKKIYKLRNEKGLTQRQLADELHISDKTVSKWETGMGCPDISLLGDLCKYFNVSMEGIIGEEGIDCKSFVSGNLKKSQFYVCPFCGNVVVSTGEAGVSCCGRKLEQLVIKKAHDQEPGGDVETEKLQLEVIEGEWYITSRHPMKKDNYISFVALLTGDKMQMIKLFPEWDLQVRMPRYGHGMLVWYSTSKGLMYQLV